MEHELAAQARSVAESILASPKVDPTPNLNQHLSDLKISHEKIHVHDESHDDDGEQHIRHESNITGGDETAILFLGDLSRTVDENALRTLFEPFGEITAIDIKRDKITQNNLGYGFIQFKTRDMASHAKKQVNHTELLGRKIRIGWAQKNTTLFIGDLDGTVTSEQLRQVFNVFGPLIEDETFVKSGSGKYGFVRFQHREDAEKAKIEMNRKIIGTRAIRIGWGDNNTQKHCIHIQFNPSQAMHITEQMIRSMFESYGTIVNISLPRYTNKRLKGYAFVHFNDNDDGETSALNAIQEHHESILSNVPIKVSYGKRQVFTRHRRNEKTRTAPSQQTNGYYPQQRQPLPYPQYPVMNYQYPPYPVRIPYMNQYYQYPTYQNTYPQQYYERRDSNPYVVGAVTSPGFFATPSPYYGPTGAPPLETMNLNGANNTSMYMTNGNGVQANGYGNRNAAVAPVQASPKA